MPRSPLVSVVVPNFNHARFLEARLDSIFAQTFRDFEVIILDDASTDDSRSVIRRYLGTPGVRFLPSKKNSGSPFIQWNRGVASALGELIWIAESDDVAAPDFLATLVPILQSDPTIGLCYCQSYHIDGDGNNNGPLCGWTEDLAPGRWKASFRNQGSDEVARFHVLKNPILNASAVVFRRSVYQLVGGAPSDLRECGDWLTWSRMLLHSDVRFEAAQLNYFRTHSANVRTATRGADSFVEFVRVQALIASSVAVSPSVEYELCRRTLGKFRDVLCLAPPTSLTALVKCSGTICAFAVNHPRSCACILTSRLLFSRCGQSLRS